MSLAPQHDADLTRWGSTCHAGRERSEGASVARLLMLMVGLLGVILVTQIAAADSIRLHEQAGATSLEVTLAQVAELEGPTAREHSDLVVYRLQAGQETGVVTLEELRAVLSAADVNWARTSLKGYKSCRLTLIPKQTPVIVDADPVVASNPEAALDSEQPIRLEQIIVRHLAAMLGVSEDSLSVVFAERDLPRLHAASLAGRLEIEPLNPQVLGRCTIRVRRHEGVEVTETLTFSAVVSKRMMGLVVTQPVRKGDPIEGGVLELREVLVNDNRSEPLTDRAMVSGQAAAFDLAAGEVLSPRHLRPVVLIKRGESIKVRSTAGGMVVRINATALEAGGRDDIITVRNQTSRQALSVQVIGPREAVVVGQEETLASSTESSKP